MDAAFGRTTSSSGYLEISPISNSIIFAFLLAVAKSDEPPSVSVRFSHCKSSDRFYNFRVADFCVQIFDDNHLVICIHCLHCFL